MTALDVELRAAFRCTKAAARHAGIDWALTFDDFYEWWTQEDRWSRRGRTAGRISMARRDGRGPFALWNLIEIERAYLIRTWLLQETSRAPLRPGCTTASADTQRLAGLGSVGRAGHLSGHKYGPGRVLAFRIRTRFTVNGL
jgi:hypothetical protein